MKKNKDISKVFLIITLMVLNAFLNCSPINLILTIPQCIYVAYLALSRKYESAVFFHLLFIVTSFSYNVTSSAMDELGVASLTSYNYSKFKVASVPIFFVNTLLIIWGLHRDKFRISNQAKKSDFYKFYTFVKYTSIAGISIGFVGVILFNYFVEGFITYGSYALFLLTTSYVFLLLYETRLKELLYNVIPTLLIVGILTLFLFNIGGVQYIGTAYITYFSALLLPYALYNKRVFIPITVLLIYMVMNLIIGTGGKMIIQFALVFASVFFLTFSKKLPVPKIKLRRFRAFYYILLVFIPVAGVYILSSAMGDEESNFMYKLHNVQTLFGFIFGQNGIYEIDRSPYIRVAEFLNIIYEDLMNPIYLIIGRGFGGYYQDVLGLFNAVDLSFDAFSDEQLIAKKYYTAHDAFVSIPMMNGLIGVYLWIKTIASYMKHVYRNYLKIVVLPFLLLIFYFDSQIGLIGAMLLFASEYNSNLSENVYR